MERKMQGFSQNCAIIIENLSSQKRHSLFFLRTVCLPFSKEETKFLSLEAAVPTQK